MKKIREESINNINEINEASNNDIRIFKAIKNLRQPQECKNYKIIIQDDNGKNIANENEKYNTVKEHFMKKFYNEHKIEIEPYKGKARPLHNKITKDEVNRTTMKVSNNKAAGEDGITNEMTKYNPEELHQKIANKLNEILKPIQMNLTKVNHFLYQYQSQTNQEVQLQFYG